ncbi:MAG TPA: hypothetical protein VGS27_14320 [Candidatus Sulfotelmatobacter sp.]|nr:hypothetical protein [Candidatus Sulfotelmatobacter sp.]
MLPAIEGESLAGGKVTLPEAARGKIAVLILGFTKASKEPTSAWANKLYGERPSAGLQIYQLPILEDVPGFIRGIVISSMKKGVPEDRRDHFVPIVKHEAALKKLVSYKEPDDAYLIVLDVSGEVAFQIHGPSSDVAYRELSSKVQSLLNGQK